MKDTATHYHVKVGPYWHRVDRITGHHVVVDKEQKQPEYQYHRDQAGSLHITKGRRS